MDWIERDLAVNWHPYTQMQHAYEKPPVLIERARGLKLYDNKGSWYYDAISSWWCNIHGHNHPFIMEAIRAQTEVLDHVLFAGFTHRGAVELAEKLVAAAPERLTRAFFSDNGSTAVEVAMKMSFQYWQNKGTGSRTGFLSFDRGYHGDTIGAMSVSGVDVFNKRFAPLFCRTYKVTSPQGDGENTLKELERILKDKGHEIAAMIIEPLVLCAGGMRMYSPECLCRIRELTGRYDVHLIADEIAVGFGRTGRMLACDHSGVSPDFMCLSKGMTSGTLPISVTLTGTDIYESFLDSEYYGKTFFHGHTYTANPLACAAALATLDLFTQERTMDNVADNAELFRDRLNGLGKYDCVSNARVLGFIGAVDISGDISAADICSAALNHNLLLRPLGNVLYVFPPLAASSFEINDIYDRIHAAICDII